MAIIGPLSPNMALLPRIRSFTLSQLDPALDSVLSPAWVNNAVGYTLLLVLLRRSRMPHPVTLVAAANNVR